MTVLRRPEFGKPRQERSFDEFEVRDSARKFLEPSLAVGNIGIKQILMVIIEGFAVNVLISAVAESDRGARQRIIDPAVKARLLRFGRIKRYIKSRYDGSNARSVGFRIALERSRLETLALTATAQQIVGTCSQEELEHLGHPDSRSKPAASVSHG